MLRLIATALTIALLWAPAFGHGKNSQRHTSYISGVASWYDCKEPGECSPSKTTASGEVFDASAHKCAMLAWPLGTHVRIRNLDNGRWSYCTVNDSGPYYGGRIIDLTPRVRDELGMGGTANVQVYRQ